MEIGDRISLIRKNLNISQGEFGKRINVTRSAISNYEKGTRNITDRPINDICREFNVNEEWLRNGTGEMFVDPDTFSLDEYCKAKGASDTAIDIIKLYLGIPENVRNDLEEYFVTHVLTKHSAENEEATTTLQTINTSSDSFEEYKRRELEAYALELEAEAKGEILSALENQKGVS